MIKANELRIGNCVYISNEIEIIEQIYIARAEKESYRICTNKSFGVGIDAVEPISLTLEILEKCNIQEINNCFWDPAGMLLLKKQPKSLHQLQNFYFALTNTELEINLTANVSA